MQVGLRIAALGLLAACTGPSEPPREPIKVDFREVQGVWKLQPAQAETQVGFVLDDQTLDFGKVPGVCKPSADVPFTEVQGQKSVAALQCASPDGMTHHVVLVEVMGDDPTWPAPVGLAVVLTRASEDGKIALLTLGMQDLPLGVTPLPPAAPAPSVEPAPAVDTDL